MNAIDEITLDKTKKLIQQLNWKNDLVTALQTYPCFNELTNLSQKDRESRMCVGCSSDLLMYRIVVYGLPYDNITLAGVTSTSTATKKVSINVKSFEFWYYQRFLSSYVALV